MIQHDTIQFQPGYTNEQLSKLLTKHTPERVRHISVITHSIEREATKIQTFTLRVILNVVLERNL
jgi:hypothetical protein